MDPATLAVTVTTMLAPYLVKLGESFAGEVGKRLPDKLGKVWETISGRFKGNSTASSVANNLVKKADDNDNQEAFTLQLKDLLKDDKEFAEALQAALKEAQIEISNVGDGVAGKINIDGNVNGNIVIGNNNQINYGYEKKN